MTALAILTYPRRPCARWRMSEKEVTMYEYKVWFCNEDMMNELAREGWRVIAAMSDGAIILERELLTKRKPPRAEPGTVTEAGR